MTGMEDKQPVSTTSSVSAARLAQSTAPPLGEGRSVSLPPPELEIVPIAATPVPEPELTVGDRPTTNEHLEETVLYLVDDYYMVGYSPSRPAYRPRVVTSKQPFLLPYHN